MTRFPFNLKAALASLLFTIAISEIQCVFSAPGKRTFKGDEISIDTNFNYIDEEEIVPLKQEKEVNVQDSDEEEDAQEEVKVAVMESSQINLVSMDIHKESQDNLSSSKIARQDINDSNHDDISSNNVLYEVSHEHIPLKWEYKMDE